MSATATTPPPQRAAHWVILALLVLAVLGLRDTHTSWMSCQPGSVGRAAGWIARVLVLFGGLSFVQPARARTAPLWRPTAVARGAFTLAVLYLAALCLSPFDRALAVTWAAAVVGLSVVAWASLGPLSKARPRLVHALDIALTNVALTLVGLELGLVVLSAFMHTPLLSMDGDARGRAVWEWRRREPGSAYLGDRINAWGDHEDPPRVLPADACSVVSIGDSFSTGVVPLAYHFTSIAEAAGNCDVYNMGASSIGPPEYLYLLRTRAPQLDPDAIVVNLYLFNDVHDVERIDAPPPWIARERRRVYLVGSRLLAWSMERAATGRPVGRGPEAQAGGTLEERFPWLSDPTREPPGLSTETYLTVQTENAERVLGSANEAWGPFFDTLTEMLEAAGDRLLFMLIPSEVQVEDGLWAQVQARSRVPIERDAAERRVVRWLRERGVPTLDLLPVLRDQDPLPDGQRHLFHLRDTHLNARGNAAVGRALARFIEENVEP
ncbi:MAG: hypothetical protein AB8I08_36665 [Sandaracinaceae bacterium]